MCSILKSIGIVCSVVCSVNLDPSTLTTSTILITCSCIYAQQSQMLHKIQFTSFHKFLIKQMCKLGDFFFSYNFGKKVEESADV